MKRFLISLSASLMLVTGLPAWADASKVCGKIINHYGPFDYRSANAQQRDIVERAHFDEGVQTLTKGKTGPFGADIDYTLSVFPNHPLALMVMERLAQKERREIPNGARFGMDCWYERALRWRPDDHIPRLLYANYLINKKRTDEALKQLDYVAESTQDNPIAQFNTGMLYLDMQAYDQGLRQAHRVLAMGFDRPELRNRLQAAGRWVEPPADAASAPVAAASAASAP